uniref:Sulfotransferase n=1 Tax=Chelydra serpentina TaxID=8475 RepID=A0A8C3XRT7_CHESE
FLKPSPQLIPGLSQSIQAELPLHVLRRSTFLFSDFAVIYFLKTRIAPLPAYELFQIRLFSFPGTVWTQNILSLIYHEGHRDGTENMEIIDRVPWLEYNIHNMDYVHRPSPRLFTTHLPYYLAPRDLRNRRAKIIYVARNPKDVVVSYFHFSSLSVKLETVPDFNSFLERFLAGKVLAGSWLDHVRGWSTHRDEFNILFLTFEEIKKDLRGAVLKICKFLGKQLNEKELDTVVEMAAFDKMKSDPRANYEFMEGNLLEKGKGHFLRKGTVGDWKNTMTVAQSERFDNVFKEKMKDLLWLTAWMPTASRQTCSILNVCYAALVQRPDPSSLPITQQPHCSVGHPITSCSSNSNSLPVLNFPKTTCFPISSPFLDHSERYSYNTTFQQNG